MKYILKKTGFLVITLLVISFITFLAFNIIPGDAALSKLGTEATVDQVNMLREELGLNAPFFSRYLSWLGGFIGGDFGISFSYMIPVKELISGKFMITITMTIMAFVFIILFSIPIAVFTAYKENKIVDRVITFLNQLFMSIPGFFLGILITFIFGLTFKIFMPGAYISMQENIGQYFYYLLFPSVAMAIPKTAMGVKILRSSLIEEKKKRYVRAARSRGNSNLRIYGVYMLKNAVIPVLTFWAMTIADLIANSVIIERVFSIPGIGTLLVSSIANRDFAVVQAIIIIIAVIIIVMNYLVDLLYKIIDPRIDLKN